MTETANGQAESQAGDGPITAPIPPASTLWRALGEVAAILSVSPAYKFYSLADLEWLVVPALQHNQYRICHKGPRPIGVVLWAKIDAETAAQIVDPRFRLRPDQWDSGDQIWVTDLVHTGGSDAALTSAMLRDVQSVLGAEVKIHVRPAEIMARLRQVHGDQPAPHSAG